MCTVMLGRVTFDTGWIDLMVFWSNEWPGGWRVYIIKPKLPNLGGSFINTIFPLLTT